MRTHARPIAVLRLRAAVVALAFATTAACAPAVAVAPPVSPAVAVGADSVVVDRLYFGRNIPTGGTVPEEAWRAFLEEVVTKEFPDGLTVYTTQGQWREGGKVDREVSMVVEIVHPVSAEIDAALEAIAREYVRRFSQSAVMRVTTPARQRFYSRQP